MVLGEEESAGLSLGLCRLRQKASSAPLGHAKPFAHISEKCTRSLTAPAGLHGFRWET